MLSVRQRVIALALLWLVGINLRTVLLGVPPALPTLHRALGLSYSAAGLLTSLQTVELVLFLDQHFGIDITDDEFVEENFNTVDAIARLVASKRG